MARKKPKASSARSTRPRQSAAELAPKILEKLPGNQASVARALDRKPSDGTVRRALASLVETGAVQKNGNVFERCQELPTLPEDPPDEFDATAQQLWRVTLTALQEQGTWRDHDIELLNDYCRRSQDARDFRLALDCDGRFTVSKGRIYAHPAIDKERDARRDVQALRDALVLTPDARKKHGHAGEEGDDSGDEFDDL